MSSKLARFALVIVLSLLAAVPVTAQDAPEAKGKPNAITGTWVVTIPQAFPMHVFTWQIAEDGTYQESGRNVMNARRTQVTGQWSLQGVHAVMTQSSEGFVFDGTVAGGCYIGRMMHNGKNISSFTARKRGSTVRNCDGDVTI